MSSQKKIFRLWSKEGFLAPVFDPLVGLPDRESVERFHIGQPIMPWKPWHLIWDREKRSDRVPDFSGYPLPASCKEEVANRLWPTATTDFELLPIFVDETPWRLICSKQMVSNIDLGSSEINWSEWEDDGRKMRVATDVRWVNVVDPRANEMDAFRLSIQPRVLVFFTEKFAERYLYLGLEGVSFEHVGYIVDKPENAVPPPPRPVPQVQQAPRWPKWETALDEEMAPFVQGGQAFLSARGLSESSEVKAILSALATEIDAHRADFGKLKPKLKRTLLEGLSGALGLLLRQHVQWNWVVLQVTSRTWDVGLESPNGSHALCLNQVMVRQLTSPQPSTIELLFNMIAENNLPDGGAGDHVAIG